MATLLDGVEATGAGNSFAGSELADILASGGNTLSNISVVIAYETNAPTAATVVLQGSLDGVSWVDIGDNGADVSADSVGFSVAHKPHNYFRGNMTAYTAGSCTGVTMKAVGV